MAKEEVAELDRARINAIRTLRPELSEEELAQLAWAIREADDSYGVVAVPLRPTIAMVFEAQRIESGDPEFDALAPHMYEWYEVMVLSAIEASPYRYAPRVTN